MAHTITRRWAAIATVATTALLVMAGCGKSGDDPAPGPSGDGAFGGAASASATTDPSANPTSTGTSGTGGGGGGGGGGGSTQTDPYPKDAKAYQQAFLTAFSAGDRNRIADLSGPDQILETNNSLDSSGKPNGQWTANSCGGNTCNWHNAYGDIVITAVDTNKLGQPKALTYVSIDRTMYPSDPASYVSHFLAAAEAHNQERMLRLSNATTANRMTNATQLDGVADVKDLGGGYSQVDRHQVNRTDPWYSFKVLSAPGGKAGAIASACAGYGCAL
jgi:hypothetical protein